MIAFLLEQQLTVREQHRFRLIRRLYRAAAREWRLRVLQSNCEGYGWA